MDKLTDAFPEGYVPAPHQPGHDLDPDHYKYLSKQEKYRRIFDLQATYEKTSESKAEYRERSLYKNWVGILNTEYHLTKDQKKWLYTAIERLPVYGGMKEVLCRNCSYEQILTSLAIRLMRRNKRRFSIDSNKFCKSINLTSGKYYGIIENREDLQEKGLMNFNKASKTKIELLEKSENYRKEIEMIYALREIKRKAPHRKLNN